MLKKIAACALLCATTYRTQAMDITFPMPILGTVSNVSESFPFRITNNDVDFPSESADVYANPTAPLFFNASGSYSPAPISISTTQVHWQDTFNLGSPINFSGTILPATVSNPVLTPMQIDEQSTHLPSTATQYVLIVPSASYYQVTTAFNTDTIFDGTFGGLLTAGNLVINSSTNGTAVVNGSGQFTFTPDPGFTGTGNFTYTDTTLNIVITIMVIVRPPVLLSNEFLQAFYVKYRSNV